MSDYITIAIFGVSVVAFVAGVAAGLFVGREVCRTAGGEVAVEQYADGERKGFTAGLMAAGILITLRPRISSDMHRERMAIIGELAALHNRQPREVVAELRSRDMQASEDTK